MRTAAFIALRGLLGFSLLGSSVTAQDIPSSENPQADSFPIDVVKLDEGSPSLPVQPYGPPDLSASIEVPPGVPRPLALGVATALADYPSIRAGRLNEQASEFEIEAAKGRRYPSVSLQGLSFAGGSSVAGNNLFAANLVVDQPIWSGGRISAEIERARAARAVSSAELVETAEALAIQTINAYYEAVLAARRMDQLSQGNDALLELVASIERRVAQQVSPTSELILVQSRQAEIERQFNLAQASFLSSREIFRQLTGLYSYELTDLPEYDSRFSHPDRTSALEQASQCNPAVARLNAEVRLAEATTELAEKQLYPQVSAQFSQNEVTGARVGLAVTAQLNNGLSQFSVIKASGVRALEAGAQADAAARDSRLRLTTDLLLNYSTKVQIPIAIRSVKAAQDVTASYQRQFIAGRKSWLEVVNAVREEITADLSLVDAETTAMASAARLLRYTCRWTSAIGG